MFNTFSRASGPLGTGDLALQVLWYVDADRSYRVKVSSWPSENPLIAVRTVRGEGRLQMVTGEVVQARAETLYVMDTRSLRSYWCPGAAWQFWWFIFTTSTPEVLPRQRLLSIPLLANESRTCQALFTELRSPTKNDRRLASARFTTLLYEWQAQYPEPVTAQQTSATHRAATIDAAIELMHRHLAKGDLTVAQMAAAAGLGERRFRTLFRERTGLAPKFYFDQQRLLMARDLLRLGGHSVKEVAHELGYSSPFHLSKAFKHHFGQSPAK